MERITQTPEAVILAITIPKVNDLPQRLLAAFAGVYGPIPVDPDTIDPETGEGKPLLTPTEFAWRKLREYVQETLARHEREQAILAAQRDAESKARTDAEAIT